MKLKERRLSFEPIEKRCRLEHQTDEDFAAFCGITRKTMRRYRECGLGIFNADRISCRLGFHPTYFWGEDYFGPIYENGPEEEID